MADDVSTMKVTDSGDAMAPEEPSKAQQLAQLTQLSAQAEQKYLLKDYSAAADLYAQATELQAKLNGEMAPQNAELLFLYGRSLYKVGVSNSEVLGGGVGGAAGSSADAADEKGSGVAAERSGRKHNQAVPLSAAAAAAAAAKGRANEDEATERAAPSTLFQFSGDENFDVAEDDEDGGDDDADNDAEHEGDEGEEAGAENGPANAEDESEDDDFGTAWVSLDLARVLFARQLEELERASATTVPTETPPADAQRIDKGKERADPEPAHVVRVKTRLADTHGLLGDISLEHEEYGAAVDDFRAALALKRALYAPASSVVAEAHYKLSLALEFVSIENRAGAADGGEELRYDAAMRAEAAAQMEAAIGSARARLAKEEEELLRGSQAAAGSSVTKESLQELREVIEDMEQRVRKLQNPNLPSIPSAFSLPRFP
jgi:HAT1-interacting factor 1